MTLAHLRCPVWELISKLQKQKGEKANDFHELSKRVMLEYRNQQGFNRVEVEGHPAIGLRYKFSDVGSAARFFALREAHNSFEPSNSNILGIDGTDVVEIWEL